LALAAIFLHFVPHIAPVHILVHMRVYGSNISVPGCSQLSCYVIELLYPKTTVSAGWPKKVSLFQESLLNRIKNREEGETCHQYWVQKWAQEYLHVCIQ